MSGKSTVPRYGDLITATYSALKILGGSGKNEEINEKVVELLSLSRSEEHTSELQSH